jgi:hypothetical protein
LAGRVVLASLTPTGLGGVPESVPEAAFPQEERAIRRTANENSIVKRIDKLIFCPKGKKNQTNNPVAQTGIIAHRFFKNQIVS